MTHQTIHRLPLKTLALAAILCAVIIGIASGTAFADTTMPQDEVRTQEQVSCPDLVSMPNHLSVRSVKNTSVYDAKVTWRDKYNDENCLGEVLGYTIRFDPHPEGGEDHFEELVSRNLRSTTIEELDTDLAPGRYIVSIKAHGSNDDTSLARTTYYKHLDLCSDAPVAPDSLTVTLDRADSAGTNHDFLIAWTDSDNIESCISGYGVEYNWIDEDGKKQYGIADAQEGATSYSAANKAPGHYWVSVRAKNKYDRYGRSAIASHIHPEPDEEEEEELPWPPTVEYSNHTTDTNDWTCLGFRGCGANYTVTFSDPEDNSQTTSDTTFGYQFRNLTYPTNSDGLDEENGIRTEEAGNTIQMIAGTVVQIRAKRLVGEEWSDWSLWKTRYPMPTAEQAIGLDTPTAPENFTATYLPDAQFSSYRLEFDGLPMLSRSPTNWTGGLPILHYEWGWVHQGAITDADDGCPYVSYQTDDMPTQGFPALLAHSDGYQARHSVEVNASPLWKMVIRAVTLAGTGKCSVIETVGTPPSPPTVTFERPDDQSWGCIWTRGCRDYYNTVFVEPTHEKASQRYGRQEIINSVHTIGFQAGQPNGKEKEAVENIFRSLRTIGDTVQFRAKRRVDDNWSEWSEWATLQVTPTPAQLETIPKAEPPPNFTATYIPNNRKHRLTFDGLKSLSAGQAHWSGGLPVINYEWGQVYESDGNYTGDTIGSNGCPMIGSVERAPFGRLFPTQERDTYTVNEDMGTATRVFVRAVTAAGKGKCAVVNTTGNPDNPPPSRRSSESESTTLPTAPTNLTASISGGNIVLTWNQPTDKSITGYQILRRRPKEGETQLKVYVNNTGSKNRTYTDTDAPSGTTYVYRVKALNSSGDESSVSNFAKVDHN